MNFLFLADEGNNPAQSWPILLMFGGLLVISILMSVIPQRKRKKQMMEMMASIGVGSEIRTIGGMVGTVISVDDENGLFVINVGTEANPTYIKISRDAVYVPTPVAQPAPVEEVEGESATLNGGDEDNVKSSLKE